MSDRSEYIHAVDAAQLGLAKLRTLSRILDPGTPVDSDDRVALSVIFFELVETLTQAVEQFATAPVPPPVARPQESTCSSRPS